jgi:hypothetical protein
VLQRDIQEELAIIHNLKSYKKFSDADRRREEMVLQDLAQVEQFVGQEIWDTERE